LTLAVAGCASGLASAFPTPLDPRTSATVIVARNNNLRGATRRVTLTLDGFEIAKLNVAEYVRFSVPPGTHAVGPKPHSISLNFEAGQEYFLWISPGGVWDFEVERLQLEDGRKRMAGYRDLSQPP